MLYCPKKNQIYNLFTNQAGIYSPSKDFINVRRYGQMVQYEKGIRFHTIGSKCERYFYTRDASVKIRIKAPVARTKS